MFVSYKKNAVTLKDIAAKVGLSVKAVSTGLNGTGRLSPETRRRIIDMADAMGYTPNAAARGLVTRRSYLIGVLVPFLNNSFFSNIIAGIEQVAYDDNFSLLLANLPTAASDCRQAIGRLMQREIDGLIIYPCRQLLEAAKDVHRCGVPVVQLMNSFKDFGEYAVTIDNFQAGYAATEYLRSLGHRNIAMVTHDAESAEVGDRHRGFLSAMQDIETACCECPMSFADGRLAGERLLKTRPDISAIFAASDTAALGVLQVAIEYGRRIGEDLSIIGFDDLDIAARQLIYPLTTMAQPKEEIGRLAGRLLLDILAGKSCGGTVLQAPLTVRKTTGEYRK